jgi:ribosomal protein S18 acetylase RimI-like enzyme
MPPEGRWHERDMTHARPSRARLRPFRLEDAADLCRIYPTIFVDTAVHYGNSRITVAEADGHAVGFVMWGPAFEPAWFDPGIDRWAELHELHVDPEHQDRGIGTRLVRAAIRQARDAGFPVFYVVTDDSNDPARRVYEKNGFVEHNRIIRYKVRL